MNNASLYIHMPWCIKKCPYCDFNSHEIKDFLPEKQYIQALIEDFKHDIAILNSNKRVNSRLGLGPTNNPESEQACNKAENSSAKIDSQQLDFQRGASRTSTGVYIGVNEDASEACNKAESPRAKSISSIFIGGGTPSLFSAQSYNILLNELKALVNFKKDIEITIEANPGTIDLNHLAEYRKVGINRLSLGIQSFNDSLLKKIGRIHSAKEALNAVKIAKDVGFDNINIDLMYGIPDQTLQEGLYDIKKAIELEIQHISWYQFTIEKNTYFYKNPPPHMPEETTETLETEALALLKTAGFIRYEISAFKKTNHASWHNLNYWTFGDYFGIGAGAHGKLTDFDTQRIIRTQKPRLPKSYLAGLTIAPILCTKNDIIFEFMLNTTRLYDRIPLNLFTQQTGLPISIIQPLWKNAEKKGLIALSPTHWTVTELGRRFTNDLQLEFLL